MAKPKTVPVYDFETEQVSEIPEAELAPGMVRAQVEGVGLVWIDASKVKQTGEFRHGPFDPGLMEIIASIRERLIEVRPMSLKQWEDGFRMDITPEREIAVWDHVARVYKQCVEEFNFPAAQRKEIWKVLVGCLTAPRESVLTVAQLDRITKEQAQRAIDLFFHWNKHIGEK